jgi:hypothetical protein
MTTFAHDYELRRIVERASRAERCAGRARGLLLDNLEVTCSARRRWPQSLPI